MDESMEDLLQALDLLYQWVGTGYPDLDDPEERELFMLAVTEVAGAYMSFLVAANNQPRTAG